MDNCPLTQIISRRSEYLSAWFLGISLLAFGVILAGCKNKSGLSGPGDSPVIMSTTPVNNAVDVAVNSTVTAVFNDQMDPQTLTDTTFILRNDTVAVTGTINYSDSTATFTPSSNLSFGGVYTATITADVENLSGITMENDFEWSFTTEEGATDTTQPQVVSTNPANNAENVSVNTELTATFNEPMNASTISTTTFTVAQGGTAVPGSVSYEGTTATFSPANVFEFGTDYTATITTAAEDTTGNALANNVTWNFSTETEPDTQGPEITSNTPADNADDVPVTTNISATFNEPVDQASVREAFTVSQNGSEVAGSVSFSENTATFNPTNDLNFETEVTATVSTGAQDLAGNALSDDFSWSFTTSDEPDNIVPEITSFEPADNAEDVPVNTNISVTFSESMNQASVQDAFTVSQNGSAVGGNVTFSGNTATFNPTNNLNFATTFTATISTDAKDLAGNALADDFSWSFTTGREPDRTAPTITSTVPADNAKNVPVATNITAVFSEAINGETVNATTFTVSQGGSNIAGALNVDGADVIFNPNNNLAPTSEVTITITTGVQDMAGNNLANNFTWNFTTEQETTPPVVSSTNPTDDATDVPVNTNISVTFNEAMDEESVRGAFTVSQNGSAVNGSITFNNNTAIFNPDNNLNFATTITATISTGAQDVAGNNLTNNFSWKFTTEQETVPPVVQSTNPVNDAVDVAVESNITATFNEAMNPATINGNTFVVSLNGTQIEGDVSYSNGTARFNPTANLARGATYGATITTGAQDVAGNALQNNFNWRFTTEQETTPPVVNSTSPADDESNVPVNTNIRATFSEPMNQASVQEAFTVSQDGNDVAGNVTFSGNTAIFNPSNNLSFNTEVTATISTDARDLAGNNLAKKVSWKFTTEQESTPPVVSLVSPTNNEDNVSVTTNISVGFSEAMNSATINNTTFTVSKNGNAIPGKVTYSGTTATFNPDNNLPFGSTITATVTTGVEDLAGNNLQSNYTWNFNTEQETTPPEVSSMDPTDGETDVLIDKNISATFTEEMDPETIDETTFTISQEGTAISGEVSYSGTKATFNPSSDLTFNTEYTATITTGARDLAGNALTSNVTWNFTTQQETIPPKVISVDPVDDATLVPVNTTIKAEFSEPMDPSTINSTNFSISQGEILINGTVEYSNNTATFTPAVNLSFDTQYNVIITTGVQDLVGNALLNDYQWNFTTEGSPADKND